MKLRKRSFPGSAIELSSKNFGFEDGLQQHTPLCGILHRRELGVEGRGLRA